MTLQLGDQAPDFTATTTIGEISLHTYLGDGWGLLFSHPKDFTPVCTTELGTVSKLLPEFEKRSCKVLAHRMARCSCLAPTSCACQRRRCRTSTVHSLRAMRRSPTSPRPQHLLRLRAFGHRDG